LTQDKVEWPWISLRAARPRLKPSQKSLGEQKEKSTDLEGKEVHVMKKRKWTEKRRLKRLEEERAAKRKQGLLEDGFWLSKV
jgi:hypothetical protein